MLDTIDPELLAAETVVLATVGATGTPQLTAVWFIVEDGHVLISAQRGRQKVVNLERRAECSLLIYHPSTVNYFVEIRGTAAIVDDADYAVADRISPKYHADFRNFDGPGAQRVIIDVTPAKVIVTDVRH